MIMLKNFVKLTLNHLIIWLILPLNSPKSCFTCNNMI